MNNSLKAFLIPAVIVAVVVVGAVLADVLVQLNTMSRSLAQVSDNLRELHDMNVKLDILTNVDQKLAKTNGTLAALSSRIDSMNTQLALLDTMSSELGQTNVKIGKLSNDLTVLPQLEGHIDVASTEIKLRVRKLVSNLDDRLASLPRMEGALKETNGGITSMQTSLGNVSDSLGGMKTQLGVLTPMNEKLGVLTPMNDSLRAMAVKIDRSLLLGIGH